MQTAGLLGDLGVVGLGRSRVDQLGVMRDHRLDETVLEQLVDGALGQRASDLQTLTQDGRSDQLVARHLLHQLVVGRLIEEHQVVQLVTDLALRPLLLLRLASGRTRARRLLLRLLLRLLSVRFWRLSGRTKFRVSVRRDVSGGSMRRSWVRFDGVEYRWNGVSGRQWTMSRFGGTMSEDVGRYREEREFRIRFWTG